MTAEQMVEYYDDMRRKISPEINAQAQKDNPMEDRVVYLYKTIMKNGKDAIDEIKTLDEAKEVIKLMSAHDMVRFMALRSFERTLDLSEGCGETLYLPRKDKNSQ